MGLASGTGTGAVASVSTLDAGGFEVESRAAEAARPIGGVRDDLLLLALADWV